MKRKLQRIVSVVCALALMIGCGVFASLAEGTDTVTRYIISERTWESSQRRWIEQQGTAAGQSSGSRRGRKAENPAETYKEQ